MSVILSIFSWTCDRCNKSMAANTYSMRCNQCNYDACKTCYPSAVQVSCPHSCGTTTAFSSLEDHAKTCTKLPVECCYCDTSVPRSQSATHRRDCSRRPTKIQAAVTTIVMFLRNVMSSNDRCSCVAFSDKYMPVASLATEGVAILSMLALLDRCNGGTHLWDAICLSIAQFVRPTFLGRGL
jgi:hypothetical protein